MNVAVCSNAHSSTSMGANQSDLIVFQPMTGGTAISHADFSPAIDAVLDSRGNDYIRMDPDGKRMRLDAHTVLKYSLSNSLLQIQGPVARTVSGAVSLLTAVLKGQKPGELSVCPLYRCR